MVFLFEKLKRNACVAPGSRRYGCLFGQRKRSHCLAHILEGEPIVSPKWPRCQKMVLWLTDHLPLIHFSNLRINTPRVTPHPSLQPEAIGPIYSQNRDRLLFTPAAYAAPSDVKGFHPSSCNRNKRSAPLNGVLRSSLVEIVRRMPVYESRLDTWHWILFLSR
jgi:hypothetical protein